MTVQNRYTGSFEAPSEEGCVTILSFPDDVAFDVLVHHDPWVRWNLKAVLTSQAEGPKLAGRQSSGSC